MVNYENVLFDHLDNDIRRQLDRERIRLGEINASNFGVKLVDVTGWHETAIAFATVFYFTEIIE